MNSVTKIKLRVTKRWPAVIHEEIRKSCVHLMREMRVCEYDSVDKIQMAGAPGITSSCALCAFLFYSSSTVNIDFFIWPFEIVDSFLYKRNPEEEKESNGHCRS